MLLKSSLTAALAALVLSTSAQADIMIHDAYGRVATPVAKTGAMFMQIMNSSDSDDRLIGATSDAAMRVEIHTHKDLGDGVMQMMEVEEGLTIPAGGTHMLQRGGDHVMFMGLNARWAQGDMIPVTLIFEQAGEISIDVMVDLKRKAEAMDHATHGN